MNAEAAVELGHNRPPADYNPTHERLNEQYIDLMARRDALLAGVENVPTPEDDETAGKIGDFIKQVAATIKNANSNRVSEKEPYLDGGRQVDGFFKGITEPLDRAKKAIELKLNVYLRAKAETERRAAEEAAKQAAEDAKRAQEEAAQQAATMQDDDTLDVAVQADEAARQAEADSIKAARDAEAKAAEFSRTRGDLGSVASLRTFWDFKIEDYDHIDLGVLRPHIPRDAIEKACRSFVKAGGRELRGVTVFENTQTVVR